MISWNYNKQNCQNKILQWETQHLKSQTYKLKVKDKEYIYIHSKKWGGVVFGVNTKDVTFDCKEKEF